MAHSEERPSRYDAPLVVDAGGFPGGSGGKNGLPMQQTQETQVRSLGQEDPWE